MSLAEYQDKFRRLAVNIAGARPSPHKICMVLALLDRARAGAMTQNRVYFAPPLLERYDRFFAAVRGPRDHANPYFPFFHLKGKLLGGAPSFWHLCPLPGREKVLASLSTARSFADVTNNIAYAELDPELFALLQAPSALDALGETMSLHWFDRGLQDLGTVAAVSGQISNYERKLRWGEASVNGHAPPPKYVRDPAFRRVVTELYDHRCAATGLRVILPGGAAMVEAAHIHPFSEAGVDNPSNGLALCPNMHWAMDRNLIAPGPDLKWHVSSALDRRIADFRVFVDLENQPVFLPREARFTPRREALEWRMRRLRSQSPLDF